VTQNLQSNVRAAGGRNNSAPVTGLGDAAEQELAEVLHALECAHRRELEDSALVSILYGAHIFEGCPATPTGSPLDLAESIRRIERIGCGVIKKEPPTEPVEVRTMGPGPHPTMPELFMDGHLVQRKNTRRDRRRRHHIFERDGRKIPHRTRDDDDRPHGRLLPTWNGTRAGRISWPLLASLHFGSFYCRAPAQVWGDLDALDPDGPPSPSGDGAWGDPSGAPVTVTPDGLRHWCLYLALVSVVFLYMGFSGRRGRRRPDRTGRGKKEGATVSAVQKEGRVRLRNRK